MAVEAAEAEAEAAAAAEACSGEVARCSAGMGAASVRQGTVARQGTPPSSDCDCGGEREAMGAVAIGASCGEGSSA